MKKLALAVITAVLCLPAGIWAQISTHDLILEDINGSPIVTLQAPLSGTPFQYVFPSTAAAVGAISFISSTSGSQASASWLLPGSDGQVLLLDNGTPTWQSISTLPAGVGTNTTLIWNGTNWVENSNVTMTPSGDVTMAGDLTVNGTNVTLPAGSIDNSELANSSVTVNAGTGLTGGGTVALGGSITLDNAGVLSVTGTGSGIDVQTSGGAVTVENTGVTGLTAGTGISLSGSTGNVTVNNSGILDVVGTTNQVNVVNSAGTATLSTPQDIHSGASPTFAGLTLTGLAGDNTVPTIVVSDGGVLKTRTVASLPGFSGVSTDATLSGDGTSGNPLGIDLANPNTWTGAQTFGVMSTTGNTTLGNGGDNITVDATTGSLNIAGLAQDNTKSQVLVKDGTTGQVYYRDAATLSGSAGWGLTGNTGTSPTTNYLGTTDAQDLVIRTNGTERARVLSGGPLQLSSTSGSTGEIRFVEPTAGGSTQYSSISAQSQSSNIRYSLPDTAGFAGDVLLVKSYNSTTGEVVLDWAEANEGGGVGSLLFARKTADETANANSLQNDDHLQIPLNANTTYEVSGALYYTASGNSNLDLAWAVPTGSTMLVSFVANELKSGNSNTGAGTRNASATGDANTRVGVNSGDHIIHFKGLVITSSSSGTLQFQWSTFANSGTTTCTMKTNSFMSVKIAEQ